MTIVKLNIKNHSAKSGEKHLHVHLFFDFRKIKIPTKIPIKRIARTAIIIPIISPLPILFLKIIKYYIHTHAFINFCYYCISSFLKDIFYYIKVHVVHLLRLVILLLHMIISKRKINYSLYWALTEIK